MSLAKRHVSDPVEKIVAAALDAAGILFIHESECREKEAQPDFYLPTYGVAVECKQLHTPRTMKQMEREPEIIVIQGRKAARAFASLILQEEPSE